MLLKQVVCQNFALSPGNGIHASQLTRYESLKVQALNLVFLC